MAINWSEKPLFIPWQRSMVSHSQLTPTGLDITSVLEQLQWIYKQISLKTFQLRRIHKGRYLSFLSPVWWGWCHCCCGQDPSAIPADAWGVTGTAPGWENAAAQGPLSWSEGVAWVPHYSPLMGYLHRGGKVSYKYILNCDHDCRFLQEGNVGEYNPAIYHLLLGTYRYNINSQIYEQYSFSNNERYTNVITHTTRLPSWLD